MELATTKPPAHAAPANPDLHQIYTNSALDRQNISPPVPKGTGGLIMFVNLLGSVLQRIAEALSTPAV